MSNRTTTDRALLVYAVRYALGRQSYAVGQVCDEVKRLAPVLDANERGVLVRDIAEALKRADDHGETLGMQMDHDEWKATLAALGAPASPQEPEVIIAPPGTRHPLSDLYADPKFQADYRTALAKEQWPSPPVAGMDAASPAPSEVDDRLVGGMHMQPEPERRHVKLATDTWRLICAMRDAPTADDELRDEECEAAALHLIEMACDSAAESERFIRHGPRPSYDMLHVDELQTEVEQLRRDVERERAARRIIDAVLLQAVEERDAERVLVEAVGRKVCELALRHQQMAPGAPE